MKFKVGDKIILGKHIDPTTGRVHNWDPLMDQYVGKVATITSDYGSGSYGSYVKVDVDNGRWAWEIAYMKPYSRNSQDDGCRCSKCREWVPYVEPSDTFVCYSCRRRL